MRKRGRPKLYEEVRNTHPRRLEFIDQCREDGVISELEHSAALHFRWVYTLRYGLPGPVSLDLGRVRGRSLDSHDSKHRYAARYYKFVSNALAKRGLHRVVANSCVYNIPNHNIKEALAVLVEITEKFASQTKAR